MEGAAFPFYAGEFAGLGEAGGFRETKADRLFGLPWTANLLIGIFR
jgi:hypothetical protein